MSPEPEVVLVPAPVPEPAPAPQKSKIETASEALADFLSHNQYSEIEELVLKSGNVPIVAQPWGDESLFIRIPEKNPTPLFQALNAVVLPKRFTAIWHRDSKDFEIIWSAYPLNALWRNVPGRKFKFRFDKHEHECEFGQSSDRLITIARNYLASSSSETNYRNLESFRVHATFANAPPDKKPPGFPETSPLSFWIRNLEWNEDKVLSLTNHLNFYLTYYDNISPTIVVHAPGEAKALKPQTRFPHGDFPTHIEGRQLDDILLQLWTASLSGDTARRFLYCFRIIEYASFSYLEAKCRLEVRRILAVPHALDNVSQITDSLVEAVQKAKLDDYPKFEGLLEDTVKPKLLWREIKENLEAFTSTTHFDGGFSIKALVAPEMTEAQFELKGIENFHRAIREIRNALAHGKDSKSAAVITPTVRNFEKLRPWVSLISVAAAEVVLFKNVI